jgi:hypothetical protein
MCPLTPYSVRDHQKVMQIVTSLAHLRFRHLGQFFMEPGDFYDVSIGKFLHFIRSVGLTKG